MKSDARALAQSFIDTMMERTGTNATQLAEGAGKATSTLTRFLQGEEKTIPSFRTMVALADFAGMRIELLSDDRPRLALSTLRLSIAIATRVLAQEPHAADRLPEAVIEIYEWILHQEKEDRPVLSIDDALLRLGPFLKQLGRSAPGG